MNTLHEISMSDIDQIDTPNPISQQTPQRLRWRIIPGTFLAIFSVIGSIGMLVQTLTIAYYNMKYGWIQMDPGTPSLSRLAITPVNVLVWQCGCWGFLSAGFSAYGWFYRRGRFAWIGMILFFAFMLTAKCLESGVPLN